ncbi:iron uptake system protein EfeO, partial [Streptomyces nigrescens]
VLLMRVFGNPRRRLSVLVLNNFMGMGVLGHAHRDSKSADGFASYDTVGKSERKKLSDGVNALAEPLSKLAAAVATAK